MWVASQPGRPPAPFCAFLPLLLLSCFLRKNSKVQKNLILTREHSMKHPFTGLNTPHETEQINGKYYTPLLENMLKVNLVCFKFEELIYFNYFCLSTRLFWLNGFFQCLCSDFLIIKCNPEWVRHNYRFYIVKGQKSCRDFCPRFQLYWVFL